MRTPIEYPKRGAWVTLSLADGSTGTCRFVWAGVSCIDGKRRWCVDHGAYGAHRDDWYIDESSITSAEPARRPPLLLSFRNPHGERCYIGRYVTQRDADKAMEPIRDVATDVRVEARP